MRKEVIFVLFALLSGASSAFAQTCLDQLDVKTSGYEDLVKCIKSDLVKGVAGELATNHADDLRGPTGQAGATVQIPSGAVLAFDRPDGCPEGWRADISAAAGRVIVGVNGGKYRLPYEGGKPSYVTGGEEEHTVTIEEMPTHRHTVTSQPPNVDIHNGFGGSEAPYGLSTDFDPNMKPVDGWSVVQHSQFMSPEGGGKPHNNMPPFIALYYCKKE